MLKILKRDYHWRFKQLVFFDFRQIKYVAFFLLKYNLLNKTDIFLTNNENMLKKIVHSQQTKIWNKIDKS
jgi:hypothetical protein